MAPVRTPRRRWVEEGLRALAAGGPGAVRVEALAEAIGVSKGGFYWAFKDRNALLDEVLDAWEHAVLDEVIARVEDAGGDARTRLRRLFSLASAPGTDLPRTDLAVRDWARRDPAVAERLRRVDDRRMAYMRGLFGAFSDDPGDVEARCLLALGLFIGTQLTAAGHGERRRAEVLERALELLEAEPRA